MNPEAKRRIRRWTARWLATAWVLVATCVLGAAAQERPSEWNRRDAWQRPAAVMDAMGAAEGGVVADIGAGRGYFTFHLAGRVGAQGKVYAVDLDKRELDRLKERAAEAGLAQIEAVNGEAADPKLPEAALDAILVVNAYHEMREFDAMLRGMFRALKPGGRLVIVDQSGANGKPRDEYFRTHKIAEEVVREDAQRNGFRLLRKEDDIVTGDKEHWFFVVFEKPRPE